MIRPSDEPVPSNVTNPAISGAKSFMPEPARSSCTTFSETFKGAERVRCRYGANHFLWFASYQLGGMSPSKILRTCHNLKGDESTILKGVKTAARGYCSGKTFDRFEPRNPEI